MINGVEFRKLTINDIEKVLKMENDFRSNFVCKENVRTFLNNPMNWLIGCIKDGQVIGFAYGYELNRLNNIGNMVYIHEVNVLEKYHRLGIGKEILRTVKRLCKLNGICRFFLFTERSNKPACAFYDSEKGDEAHEDDVAYFFHDLETDY